MVAPLFAPCRLRPAAAGKTPQEHNGCQQYRTHPSLSKVSTNGFGFDKNIKNAGDEKTEQHVNGRFIKKLP